MQKRASFQFPVLAMHADFQGQVPADKIVDLLVQAASLHAEVLDFGPEKMARQQRAWVLSRLALEWRQPIKASQLLQVDTWIATQSTLFSDRHFHIRDSHHNILAEGIIGWAVLNLNTRRPVRLSDIFDQDYTSEEANFEAKEPEKLPDLEKVDHQQEQKVRYSDLDINQHLNSMQYIRWALDSFDLSQFQEKQLKRLVVNFLAEAIYNDLITVNTTHFNGYASVELKKGQQSCARIRLDWA